VTAGVGGRKPAALLLSLAVIALAVIVLAGPARALEPAAPAPLSQRAAARQIEQTELAFAQTVAQVGIGPGFRKYAGPGAVMFTPDPSPAGPYLQTVRSPAQLVWRPQYVGVAPSDDLAFSLGPSLYKVAGRSSGGFYLTIWKRGPDGAWLFALDHGVDMPAAIYDAPPQPLTVIAIDPQARPDQSQGLREADAALDADLSNGPSRAYASWLEDEALVVRTNRPMASGRRRALKLIAEAPAILEAQLLSGGVSTDGVLGYAYGKARWSTPAGIQLGYYVRVWRNTGQGWRLLVDHLAER
jgi:ketosteroid isomerase-like protein